MSQEFSITTEDALLRPLLRRWLWLATLAVAIGGIYAVLLVLWWTTGIKAWFTDKEFFKTILVIHVDMTVLVWFLCFAGLFWSTRLKHEGMRPGHTAMHLLGLGMLLIPLAPMFAPGNPLINNYVPMLENPVFTAGLWVIAASLFWLAPRAAWRSREDLQSRAIGHSALLALASLLALLLAALQIPQNWEGQNYYESLFWGGGHILQFTHTQLMMLSWLILMHYLSSQPLKETRFLRVLFRINLIAGLGGLAGYALYTTGDGEQRQFFTDQMRYFGGLAPGLLGLWVGGRFLRTKPANRAKRPAQFCLGMSLLMFASGGVISLFIGGYNLIIPAHYHGSIVAVTLAFMGIAYYLLPRLGCPPVSVRWGSIQPLLYGGGTLLHVLGLAWLGSHGVTRKTPDAVAGVEGAAQIMHLVKGGGTLAILGGLLFVILMVQSLRKVELR